MAPTIIPKWILLIIIITVLLKLIHAQQQVPCMFLFGDSQFDNGNNNVLLTSARTNYRPYGIDYPDGPTGRFSNGRNIPDYLAEFVGFSSPISPFVNVSGSDILRGVNYASGAAGILDVSGVLAGDRFTMNMQLFNHQTIIARIRGLIGNNAVNNYLNRCLYVVNMGSNDYLNNYYLPTFSPSRFFFTPERFADLLIQTYNQQLRTLYNSGARKVAVYGLGLIGCVPQEVANFPPTNGSPCVDFINSAVQLFNNRLTPLIINLNRDLPGARFTFINTTSISLGDPSLVGIRVTNVSCCPIVSSTGLCVQDSVPCSNRNEYSFWDNFHTTEIVNRATASRSYNTLLPADASPVDIRRLVQQ